MMVTYHGHQIHYLLLAVHEFQQWLTMTPTQRMMLVKMKIDHSAFGNNKYIIDLVTQATIDTINSIMPTAQRDRALRFTMH